jgi:hypothetical protein
MTMTAGSSGLVVVDVAEVWWWEWSRAWADVGELADRVAKHLPLFVHSPPLSDVPCACFDCRAARAIAKACDRDGR